MRNEDLEVKKKIFLGKVLPEIDYQVIRADKNETFFLAVNPITFRNYLRNSEYADFSSASRIKFRGIKVIRSLDIEEDSFLLTRIG